MSMLSSQLVSACRGLLKYRHFFPDLTFLWKLTVVSPFFLSVAGIVAAKLARRAAAATPLATAAPSASIKTGRGITSSAAQDSRLNPNQFLPSLQAGQPQQPQRRQQQPGCLPRVWPGSRPPTVCPQSPVLVERRRRSPLAPPLLPPPPRPLRPTDTRRWRTSVENMSPTLFLNGEELNQQQEGTICGLS